MPTLRERVREGLPLYSADGYRLGRVARCGPTAFEVRYGFFFPKDFVVRYEDVVEANDARVTLRQPRAELLRAWRRAWVLGDKPSSNEPPVAPYG